jgi:hypothetical protein
MLNNANLGDTLSYRGKLINEGLIASPRPRWVWLKNLSIRVDRHGEDIVHRLRGGPRSYGNVLRPTFHRGEAEVEVEGVSFIETADHLQDPNGNPHHRFN